MALKDILAAVEREVTIGEALLPILVQVASDALAAANNPLAIGKLFTDIVHDIPAVEAAFKQNNVEVTAEAGGAAPQPQPQPEQPADVQEPQAVPEPTYMGRQPASGSLSGGSTSGGGSTNGEATSADANSRLVPRDVGSSSAADSIDEAIKRGAVSASDTSPPLSLTGGGKTEEDC